jgi:hypothetical protein
MERNKCILLLIIIVAIAHCLRKISDKWVLEHKIMGPSIDVFSKYDPEIYYAPA